MMLGDMFKTMEKPRVYYQLWLTEITAMVGGSLTIVVIISTFIGAVMCLQTAYQLDSDLFPDSVIGSVVSASTLLELSPTVMTLVLAGRIGSQISSQLGTMRVTEQIDAIEVMGINSVAYLIFPKVIAGIFALPMLVTVSAFLAHAGGMMAGEVSGEVTAIEFALGMRQYYDPFQVTVMYVKAFIFGFLVTSVSAYQGYYIRGGSLEVGIASTKAVVYGCLATIFADYMITELML